MKRKPGTSRKRRPRGGVPGREQRPFQSLINHLTPGEIKRVARELHERQVRLRLRNEELRRAQADLARARDQLSDLYEFAPVGYLTLDPQATILQANRTAAELLGVRRGSIVGRKLTRFIAPEGREALRRHQQGMSESGARKTSELLLKREDGRVFPAQVETVRTREGTPGNAHCRCVISDITARKAAEEAARLGEEHYRLLADHTNDIVGLNDCEGRCLYLSPSFFRKTGWMPEEVVGVRWRAHVHPEDLTAVDRASRARGRAAAASTVEHRIRCRDGTWIWVETSFKTVRGHDGSPWRQLLWSHDITEIKRLKLEIADAGEREQQRIGAELHDDLCQRLATLKLRAELLASRLETLQAEDAPAARQIWRQISEATKVARGIAKGLSPIDEHPEGLMNALSEMVATVEAMHEVPCFFHCPQPVLVQNRSAAAHLFRIAQELMNNAARHAKPHRVDMRVLANAGHVRIEVENDGSGFRKPTRNGKGMGVRIMKTRADAIGATLQFLPRPCGKSGTLAVCEVAQSVCNPAPPAALRRKGILRPEQHG